MTGTILIRYSEIGLKSDPVRRRFESILRRNMIDMLAEDGVEAVVRRANARLYVDTDDVDSAVKVLKRVFGVASLSVATVCSADLDKIKSTVADISERIIREGDTFAIDARRDGGNYPFTSMDLEKELGSVVLDANKDKGIKVKLTHPDKTIYVEVRSNKAYIFDSYIECHAGLPLGSQGQVLAYVDDDRSMISAWLMMKRGCKVIICGEHGLDILSRYDPHLKVIPADGSIPSKVLGYVVGQKIGEIENVKKDERSLPTFFPTIGMDDDTIAEMVAQIQKEAFDGVKED